MKTFERGRKRALEVGQPDVTPESPLTLLLLRKWAEGSLSATDVQEIALASTKTPKDAPDLQALANLGAMGHQPGNCDRDLKRKFFRNVSMPEPHINACDRKDLVVKVGHQSFRASQSLSPSGTCAKIIPGLVFLIARAPWARILCIVPGKFEFCVEKFQIACHCIDHSSLERLHSQFMVRQGLSFGTFQWHATQSHGFEAPSKHIPNFGATNRTISERLTGMALQMLLMLITISPSISVCGAASPCRHSGKRPWLFQSPQLCR